MHIHTSVGMFYAGDLLQQELHKPGKSGAEEARRSSLVMPMVVVYAFGIEVALKALNHRWGTHSEAYS